MRGASIVYQNDLFAIELVEGVNPSLVPSIPLQCRGSVSLIPVQSVSGPGAILAGVFRRQVSTPECVPLVLVLLVHLSEASIVHGRYPSVVMVLVPHADLELASLRLL